ncbi:MAG: P63C domain-containing protein [Limisphaerales bacterium]
MSNDELIPATASEAAKAMSALGASKGGKARANTMTAEERSEQARAAVTARWAKAGKLKERPAEVPVPASEQEVDSTGKTGELIPFSMFRGKLPIGNMEMECHVLSDGRRVFTQREIVRVLTAGRDSGNLAKQIEGNPLIPNVDSLGEIIRFKVPGTQFQAFGREATALIELCEKYMQAWDQGLLKGKQKNLATQSSIIIRACAKVGIIALVDEATGYQQVRARNALQMKLQAFIAEDLQEWGRKFPSEFWFELARLEGIHYSPRSRPLRWGKYIMAFVYDAIDKDVGKELRKKNPNPHFKKNHHQWLKEFGKDKLIGQIQSVITIMKLCTNMSDFRQKFDRVFKKTPLQTTFDDINWSDDGKK